MTSVVGAVFRSSNAILKSHHFDFSLRRFVVPVPSKSRITNIHYNREPRALATMTTSATHSEKNLLINQSLDLSFVKQLIPALSEDKYKGQAGKIGVIGGCREYTGAPFFAAYSALKVGADLSHVFCTPGAATVIKTYSPELIVHPYLPEILYTDTHIDIDTSLDHKSSLLMSRAINSITTWLDRFDVLVIGPGLGRDGIILQTVKLIIEHARIKQIPLVIDADGLWLVNKEIDLIVGYENVILTPNVVEYKRLATALGIDYAVHDDNDISLENTAVDVSVEENERDIDGENVLKQIVSLLKGPVVVKKGKEDVICGYRGNGSDECVLVRCSEKGSLRRAGGQGDVLSGVIATFYAWGINSEMHTSSTTTTAAAQLPLAVRAAYSGCVTTKIASRHAFAKHGRSMGATDVIAELGRTIDGDLA